MTTETPRPAIAYAAPIGGGECHFCADCFDAHRDDVGSDSALIADCEPIAEVEAGVVFGCEICSRVIVGRNVSDVETAIKRISESTIGRRETPCESAILAQLEERTNG
jgi:hypothetical protein